MGLAASVLYLASFNTGENITQTDIADAGESNRSDYQK